MTPESFEKHAVVPLWRSCRGMLVVTGMVGFFVMYLLRINLSLAMVCMIKEKGQGNVTLPDVNHTYWVNSTAIDDPTADLGDCGKLEQVRRATGRGEFEWSRVMRGYVLSSFYYGYIITQIPGGWLASQIGGKHVLGTGMLISIVATMLIPIAARTHVGLVIALRILMGLGMGVVFPSMHGLLGQWAPPLQRTKMAAYTYAGTMVGTVAAMSLSGLLCSLHVDNGWPLIFYIFGGAGFFWWVCWIFTAYNSPGDHPKISNAEISYIHETVGVSSSANRMGVKVPWKSIGTSMPVWAIVVAHVCNNWGGYTILSCIPMYMREVLKFDIKQNGLLSALPYVCKYIASICLATLADTIRSKGIMSTRTTRKVFQCICFLGPALVLTVMGYMDCSRRGIAVVLLTIAVTCISCGRCGYIVNHLDIAPRFAGLLFGISNTAATIPGIVAPTIAAALTPGGTQAEWQQVFFICSGVYVFGTIFFIMFASGEEQEWAKEKECPEPQKKYLAKDIADRDEMAETERL